MKTWRAVFISGAKDRLTNLEHVSERKKENEREGVEGTRGRGEHG
jgi:hypothetical protein